MDFLVALAIQAGPNIVGDLQIDLPATVVPEDHARRFFLNMEEILLTGDQAMIAFLGLFQKCQMGLELLVVGPGRAVDAGEHLVIGIPAPVSAGQAHQFEGTQMSRAWHVRANTHIRVVFVMIERDGLALGNAAHDLGLVRLVAGLEGRKRLLARHHFTDDVVIALGQLQHPFLDRLEILRCKLAAEVHVVIKAVFNDRADRHLDIGIQRLERLTKQMRTGVADDIQPGIILGRDQGNLGIMLDWHTGIGQAAIDTSGQRCLGQPCADRFGDLHAGHRVIERLDGTVGERNRGHRAILFQWRPIRRAACVVARR